MKKDLLIIALLGIFSVSSPVFASQAYKKCSTDATEKLENTDEVWIDSEAFLQKTALILSSHDGAIDKLQVNSAIELYTGSFIPDSMKPLVLGKQKQLEQQFSSLIHRFVRETTQEPISPWKIRILERAIELCPHNHQFYELLVPLYRTNGQEYNARKMETHISNMLDATTPAFLEI
ncbi:MAG: hypothetical protein OEZ58_05765 [Gammaproteobacteria bacterium]|nr:hypothetical protein [Gammaproteobacteria bacterium]